MVPLLQWKWTPPRSGKDRDSSKVAASTIFGPAAKR